MSQRRRGRPQGLQGPQISAQAHANARTVADLAAEGALAECTLHGDLSGQEADDLALDQVLGQQLRLGQTRLARAQLLDVRLDGCDLAAAVWERAHMQRVELVGCRAVGLTLTGASMDDVRFVRCNGAQLRLWSSSLRAVRFEGCDLRAASFVESDLSGVVFRRCDLTGADFRGAKLAGADLRGSEIADVQIGIAEIRGAIIDPAQLIHLAGLLGVTVQPEPDEPAG